MELLFIIDTSGSMYSNKIAAVNAALTECVSNIRNNMRRYDMQIKVSYLTFDNAPSSFFDLEDIMNRDFPDFEVKAENDFYSLTRFEAVYEGIITFSKNRSPDKNGIILITDGKATDSMNYAEKLEKAKSLDYFRNASRLVACVERDSFVNDSDLLAFVESKADRIVGLGDLAGEIDRLLRQLNNDGSGTDSNDYDSIFV